MNWAVCGYSDNLAGGPPPNLVMEFSPPFTLSIMSTWITEALIVWRQHPERSKVGLGKECWVQLPLKRRLWGGDEKMEFYASQRIQKTARQNCNILWILDSIEKRQTRQTAINHTWANVIKIVNFAGAELVKSTCADPVSVKWESRNWMTCNSSIVVLEIAKLLALQAVISLSRLKSRESLPNTSTAYEATILAWRSLSSNFCPNRANANAINSDTIQHDWPWLYPCQTDSV